MKTDREKCEELVAQGSCMSIADLRCGNCPLDNGDEFDCYKGTARDMAQKWLDAHPIEWTPEFGEKVEVSEDGERWDDRYYIGTMSDRSRKYITVRYEQDLRDYVNKHGLSCIEFSPIMRKIELPKYRPYKNAEEAVECLGKEVVIGHYFSKGKQCKDLRKVALYENGIAYEEKGKVKRYYFKKACEELRFKDGSPVGVKL